MKKFMCVLISALLIPAVFSACARADANEPGKPDNAVEETTNMGGDGSRPVDFSVQYVRSNQISSEKKIAYNTVTAFYNPEDLNRYYSENSAYFDFEYSFGSGVSFAEAMEKYDEAFFERKMLALVLLQEGSGSIRHQVDSVIWHGGPVDLSIKRLLPEMGTDDMAEWHIFIEFEKLEITQGEFVLSLTDFNILEGVTITAREAVYPEDVKEIVVDWRNNTDKNIGYGEFYHIEKNIGGKWKALKDVQKDVKEDVTFNLIGWELPSYSQQEHKYNISAYTERLEPGEYRIAAQLYPDYIYAEFRVE